MKKKLSQILIEEVASDFELKIKSVFEKHGLEILDLSYGNRSVQVFTNMYRVSLDELNKLNIRPHVGVISICNYKFGDVYYLQINYDLV